MMDFLRAAQQQEQQQQHGAPPRSISERRVALIERLTDCYERLLRLHPTESYAFQSIRDAIVRIATNVDNGVDG